MELNEFVCSMRCFVKFELWPFVLNADLCSLNCATKVLPVGPTYVLLESGHVSLYIPDCVYFSDLPVKFENSTPCACRGSTGQKP